MKTLLSDPSASFTTTGDGLRGVPVLVMDRDNGTLIHARVYSNTATRLKLDVPLSRNPDRYDAYILGAQSAAIESGDLTFGAPRERKSLRYCTLEYERGSKGTLALYLAADQTSQTRSAWSLAGYIPLTGMGYYRLPIHIAAGTGRVIRYLLISTNPGQPFTVTHFSFELDSEMNFVQ